MTIKIDQIIHSRRRTIAILVEHDGRVVVRAPLHASRLAIEQLVAEKAGWIERKQRELTRQQQGCSRPAGTPPSFTSGERFLYLGEQYPLVIAGRQAEALRLEGATPLHPAVAQKSAGSFHLRQSEQARAAEVFEAWYKVQARRIFAERVKLYANPFRLTVGRIRLSSARTRWGSCSSSGTLSFTWRLVMAPLPVIDYVVVHELAHLVEKNHSPRFWAVVAGMQPEYRLHRKWLKDNAVCLIW